MARALAHTGELEQRVKRLEIATVVFGYVLVLAGWWRWMAVAAAPASQLPPVAPSPAPPSSRTLAGARRW